MLSLFKAVSRVIVDGLSCEQEGSSIRRGPDLFYLSHNAGQSCFITFGAYLTHKTPYNLSWAQFFTRHTHLARVKPTSVVADAERAQSV